jgi:hypothetical protein
MEKKVTLSDVRPDRVLLFPQHLPQASPRLVLIPKW